MKYLLFPFILIQLSFTVFGQPRTKFSKQEILEDLKTLRNSLEETHYNIYAYTTKDAFNGRYTELINAVKQDSITLLEATNLYQQLISVINNGHTEIDFPGNEYAKYAYSGGTIFPLEIAFEDNKSFIRKNFSDNADIKIGSEIISINDVSLKDILKKIYPHISAERTYFKNAKIEMYSFPRLHWQVFGKQDEFDVEILSDGKLEKYHLTAVNLIQGYEMKRNEVMNAKMTLKFYNQSAYLNPGDFSGDEKNYQKFIDSSFVAIKQKNVSNLIVDLRNNRGGNDSFSDYLVSYFANKPFKWTSNFTIKTSQFLKDHTRKVSDTTKIYFKEILNHENDEIYQPKLDFYQPQEPSKRFDGNIYVLVNRQSYSQSTVTAAQIQDYGFGTIVGEETAEFPSLFASQFQYNLPNTGITVKVSKGKIIRINGNTDQKGVIPDIVIKDHLLDEQDEILTGLLNKLN